MSTSHRQELIEIIRRLSDEQVKMLLEAALVMQNNPDKLPYYRVEDGTIGFKDKPTDISAGT